MPMIMSGFVVVIMFGFKVVKVIVFWLRVVNVIVFWLRVVIGRRVPVGVGVSHGSAAW